ncbi:hypothetical protein IEQ34_001119 [Dendrobium chrysotoxum]|uniref:Uncharacterized protein n=1 Tax=Dendrobium chrysotoxum TaxID=161865 RepID=A0AAV7HKF5_DENCH|nr:hypothetical protein IEQ34_001119 [Dendrobium chrysotoxum]
MDGVVCRAPMISSLSAPERGPRMDYSERVLLPCDLNIPCKIPMRGYLHNFFAAASASPALLCVKWRFKKSPEASSPPLTTSDRKSRRELAAKNVHINEEVPFVGHRPSAIWIGFQRVKMVSFEMNDTKNAVIVKNRHILLVIALLQFGLDFSV